MPLDHLSFLQFLPWFVIHNFSFSCPIILGDRHRDTSCIVDQGGNGWMCMGWREGASDESIKISSGVCPPSLNWLKLSSLRSSIHILEQKQMKYPPKLLYLPMSILGLHNGLCWPEICYIGKQCFKTKKKQGLKSDTDVISISSPSLKSQYAEAFASERTSMEASWMHGQNLRPH